ncbi:MAG: DUF2642 domain-containing protein [Actinobacteria bacterium]|nr:MAG: DUF2642 domain-containing protein [Actinomycetota bacterium]
MDPLDHPDLERLGRVMRRTLDDTLEAEQLAARAAARRRRSLRDRLLDAEDRVEVVVISTVDGQLHRGVVEAVGIDHAVILDGDSERFLALQHIVSLEAR